MAIVRNNQITQGLSGMQGDTLVFKTLNGRTVLCKRPARPRTQSEAQRANRSKFRRAAAWAHEVLRHPQQKNYFTEQARQRQLPNAYTAAIAEYMRRQQDEEIR